MIQQNEECPTCLEGTVCANSDLLYINIPCTTTVVLLGSVDSLENVSDEGDCAGTTGS